jgi:hypothetical protein
MLDSATASNIYKLRRSKHELEMMQNVVESTPFPVWQIAESGNIMMSHLALTWVANLFSLRNQQIILLNA